MISVAAAVDRVTINFPSIHLAFIIITIFMITPAIVIAYLLEC